ncbi:hypothetical protein [Natrinema soli]|uniref:Uncharacterized protein n=1 Tax=Natrinema soli TaxID=1930624 RepID=A0ABD5SMU3_9EURY|nr:hypothetical protein [Natrinema soli]
MRTAPPTSLEGVSTGSVDIGFGVSRATRASIVGSCDRVLGALAIALGAEIERRIDRRVAGSTAGFVVGTIAAASQVKRVVRRVSSGIEPRRSRFSVVDRWAFRLPVAGPVTTQRVGPSERPGVVVVATVAGSNQ